LGNKRTLLEGIFVLYYNWILRMFKNFHLTLEKNLAQNDVKSVEIIIQAALQAADPSAAIQNHLSLVDNRLWIKDHCYDLHTFRRIFVLAIGKASFQMAGSLQQMIGGFITAGIVISKHKNKAERVNFPASYQLTTGGHPIPDVSSVRSAQSLIDLVQGCNKDDLVIGLISGGGSALISLPVECVSLRDIQELTRQLLACGADIGEINTLRKHLDRVKGGGLARAVYPATMVNLILSDVIGSPLDVIASGPTVADPTTFSDGYAVLQKYDLLERIPISILNYMTAGCQKKNPESIKPGDVFLENVQNVVVASNDLAADDAVETARKIGFNSYLLTTYLNGEASQVGIVLASILRSLAVDGKPIGRPACIVAGGETTVTVRGNGQGGRNLELALGAVKGLAGIENIALVTLATDGEDGPTNAAGAIVDGKTFEKSLRFGLNCEAYLKNNDSFTFFKNIGQLLSTGPTGTNVNDLVFLFSF
jgi:glycerate 2-kinase